MPSECGQFVLGIPEESVTDCLVRFQGYYVGNPADLDSTTRKLPDVSMCLPGRYSIEIDMKRKEPSGLYMLLKMFIESYINSHLFNLFVILSVSKGKFDSSVLVSCDNLHNPQLPPDLLFKIGPSLPECKCEKICKYALQVKFTFSVPI